MLLWLMLSLWQIGAFPLAEGDDEAAGVLMGFRLASAFDDPIALGSPFVQSRPPLSYLPGVLGAHLFPVNEFTMRLPYALIGAASMPLLLVLAGRAFGRRAAAFAGLLLLGTGLFAINRLTLGIGVFTTLELAGALFLLRYLDSGQRRWIVFASIAFAAAALTYLDGVMLLAAALGIAWWQRRDSSDIRIAALAGPGIVIGYFVLAAVALTIRIDGFAQPGDLSDNGIFGHLIVRSTTVGFSPSGFADTWLVYLGVPVVSLVLIGLVEAVVHNRSRRVPLLVLSALATAQAVPWLFLEPRLEHAVFVAPLVIIAAGYGWSQLLGQLQSVAAQGMVAMAVGAIALGGVVWNQAVFNPETEFTSALEPIREYGQSLEHGHGLFDDDSRGFRAIAHVLRKETEPNDRIFVSEGVPAAAITLYAARKAEPLDLDDFAAGGSNVDGAFLVIKGENDSFNAGLSGATNVIVNHRVFADGEVLYQLVQFSESGEPFQTPIWWRADFADAQLFRENTDYSDFLRPIGDVRSNG